jgi:hypothetical protein
MKPKKERKKGVETHVETHAINPIDLKAEDREILAAMAKRYKTKTLLDFLEGIVTKEQGPNIVAPVLRVIQRSTKRFAVLTP